MRYQSHQGVKNNEAEDHDQQDIETVLIGSGAGMIPKMVVIAHQISPAINR